MSLFFPQGDEMDLRCCPPCLFFTTFCKVLETFQCSFRVHRRSRGFHVSITRDGFFKYHEI